MNKPVVVVRDLGADLLYDLEQLFEEFGGLSRLVRGRSVLLKPNAVHYLPGQATDTRLLEALLRALRRAGLRDLYLMENCTAGNLTRVVFAVLGWDRLCRRYGVTPVYLDEGPTRPVFLPGEASPIRLPAFLHQRLLKEPEKNFYLNLPRLKTHSMSHVTLGIKNQQGLLIHADRMRDHNHRLGRRLVRILSVFKPDFTLVEGITATIYGHFPIQQDLEKSIVPARVLVGGRDIVAVDTVAARILGYEAAEIDHIKRAGEAGLGESDLARLRLVGSLDRFRERYPFMPEIRIPPEIKMIYGREMACQQGCRGNTEIAVHLFANDYGGKGGFNIVMGKGLDPAELEGLEGDFLVVGPCAVNEVADLIQQRYPGRRAFLIPEHNDLAGLSGKLVRLMRPKIKGLLPLPPWKTAALAVVAWARGSTARPINPF